jgi:hypothetical protein
MEATKKARLRENVFHGKISLGAIKKVNEMRKRIMFFKVKRWKNEEGASICVFVCSSLEESQM